MALNSEYWLLRVQYTRSSQLSPHGVFCRAQKDNGCPTCGTDGGLSCELHPSSTLISKGSIALPQLMTGSKCQQDLHFHAMVHLLCSWWSPIPISLPMKPWWMLRCATALLTISASLCPWVLRCSSTVCLPTPIVLEHNFSACPPRILLPFESVSPYCASCCLGNKPLFPLEFYKTVWLWSDCILHCC